MAVGLTGRNDCAASLSGSFCCRVMKKTVKAIGYKEENCNFVPVSMMIASLSERHVSAFGGEGQWRPLPITVSCSFYLNTYYICITL
ncbi:conserved domain protein [Bacteroides fluxus YIT 12057]|uniref:Conserved domain protein n=1 Tax=Bacteroides fluxus YIT 12057 TaxID=763034 RepID=F3PRZ4_9BACE|nr:conserved domain protein [Bacteroides fluxus YIT 12057]